MPSRWRLGTLLLLAVLFLLPHTTAIARTLQFTANPHLGYGANISDLGSLSLVGDLNFDWFVHYLYWQNAESSRNNYNWADLNNILNAAQTSGKKLILRVSNAPNWAWLGSGNPPLDLDEFAQFMGLVAARGQGKVAAYVIWNEPNLPAEWDGRDPQPSWFANMLKKVYPAIKAQDPDAIVVAAGMATIGGDGCPAGIAANISQAGFTNALISAGAMSDLDFIRGMYQSGAQDYFDVLATHPYGFAYSPETNPCSVNSLAFRRAEQQRAIMEAQGDENKPMWAIEFGWILDPGSSCQNYGDWPSRWWQRVTPQEQADYLVRGYQYAFDNWPWMGVMALFNLDFATVYWYDYCQPLRWYSVTYRDNPQDPANNPIKYRLAYNALQNMPQNTPGSLASLSGQVMDNRGDALAGVQVDLVGVGSTQTDGLGAYGFSELSAGAYDLSAQKSGFGTLPPRQDLGVVAGENQTGLNFYLPPADNMLANWDFEDGLVAWKYKGPAQVSADAHTGLQAILLRGRNPGKTWVAQTITIPGDISSPTLSFLYRFNPRNSGDRFRVEIRKPGGELLAAPWMKKDASSEWAHAWVDLSPYLGRRIQVRFVLIDKGGQRATAFLDEVSLGSN
ncbi:MAG: carboxypeptidase regulatory-like domain-containing protein [Chloroflexi bacterium]|nr:carboxypeptidase regulatory-like domain-containing protein [Chloroflexota bacterium]